MNELEKELSRLLKDCEIDSEYVHQDFLHIVANHFANWQEYRKYVFVSNEIQQAFDGWVQSRKGKAIYARDAFVAGMNFKEQQMMKDAVSAYIVASANAVCDDLAITSRFLSCVCSIPDGLYLPQAGDKVKLIIIKED